MLALIAFDAASSEIVDELLAEGRLPQLAALRAAGARVPLETPATSFPAAVYPTVWTGVPLERHGIHFPFMWSAEEQRVRFHTHFSSPPALWERLAPLGVRCVVVDAYESLVPRRLEGLYLRGWQFRNRVVLSPAGVPAGALRRWQRRLGRAPSGEEVFGAPDEPTLRRLADALVAAPRRLADAVVAALDELRPDLLVAGIPAVHIGGHQLWDAAAVLEGATPGLAEELRAALRRIYVEADAALGRILAALPAGADVVVFSGLGMQAETSRQDVLGAMLDAVLGGGRSDGGAGRGWDVRGRVPKSLRARAASLLPDRAATSLAAFLELRGVDWSRTRAFVLPSDTIGYVRLNLRGRERRGVVAAGEAAALEEEIRAGLTEFSLPAGRPAVAAVERRADVWPDGPRAGLLPDLVVRWSKEPARPREVLTSRSFGAVQRRGSGSGRSGNHNADAWALLVPGGARVGERREPANVIDLAATALARFGLDHDGRPLLELP